MLNFHTKQDISPCWTFIRNKIFHHVELSYETRYFPMLNFHTKQDISPCWTFIRNKIFPHVELSYETRYFPMLNFYKKWMGTCSHSSALHKSHKNNRLETVMFWHCLLDDLFMVPKKGVNTKFSVLHFSVLNWIHGKHLPV